MQSVETSWAGSFDVYWIRTFFSTLQRAVRQGSGIAGSSAGRMDTSTPSCANSPGRMQGALGRQMCAGAVDSSIWPQMISSDKARLRGIGCGCEGIASPHTEKDLRDPAPRAQRPGQALPRSFFVLHDRTLVPPALGDRKGSEDKHESVPRPALGSRAKPGQQGRRTLQGQWARGGHGDSESHVRGHIVWTILLPFCLSLLRVVVRGCCCCFSLHISTSIPEASPLQPRNCTARRRWLSQSFAPLANLIAAVTYLSCPLPAGCNLPSSGIETLACAEARNRKAGRRR